MANPEKVDAVARRGGRGDEGVELGEVVPHARALVEAWLGKQSGPVAAPEVSRIAVAGE